MVVVEDEEDEVRHISRLQTLCCHRILCILPYGVVSSVHVALQQETVPDGNGDSPARHSFQPLFISLLSLKGDETLLGGSASEFIISQACHADESGLVWQGSLQSSLVILKYIFTPGFTGGI